MRIVVIICDALRYDYYQQFMSYLNKYALNATEYTRCISCATYTRTSVSWMLCGKEKLDQEDNLIKDLRKQGFHTTIIHSSPVLYSFQSIFDKVIDAFKETHGTIVDWMRRKTHKNIAWKTLSKLAIGLGYRRAETVLECASKHFEQETGNNFTWIHLMDPHLPWNPINLDEYTNQKDVDRIHDKLRKHKWKAKLSLEETNLIRRLYLDEVRYLDHQLEKFLENLESDLTIITSDHGELLGEYDQYSHPYLMVPELLHVPLIIKDRTPSKRIVNMTTHYFLRKRILNSIPSAPRRDSNPPDFCEYSDKEESH